MEDLTLYGEIVVGYDNGLPPPNFKKETAMNSRATHIIDPNHNTSAALVQIVATPKDKQDYSAGFKFEWKGDEKASIQISGVFLQDVGLNAQNGKIEGMPWPLKIESYDSHRDVYTCHRA